MKSPVKVVLFDLGGTLFYDNAAAWPKVYKHAEDALWKVLRRAGVRGPPRAIYGNSKTLLEYYYALRGTGIEEPGAHRVLSDVLKQQGLNVDDALVEQALRAMYAVTQTNWHTEEDAQPTLRTLLDLGYRLGAVSNGSDDKNAFEILDKAGMRELFEIVVTSAAHGRRKPDASIFQAALSHFGEVRRRAAMVGDNYEADIVGGHALGLRTIWITRRAVSPPAARPVTPDATITDLSEVPAALR
jgi:putative hydrolase of the HAD superfamily